MESMPKEMVLLIENRSIQELLKIVSEHNQWESLDAGQQYNSSLYKLTSDIQELQDEIITCKEVATKVSVHLKHIIKKYHADMDDADLYAIMSLEKEVSSVL